MAALETFGEKTRMIKTTWYGEVWTMNSKGYLAIGRRVLHRVKWEKLRGPIPSGYVVHHKDHDKTNNRIANLACMSHREHCRAHMQDHVHSDAGRKKGAAVLASTAKERGQKISAARLAIKATPRDCIHCAKSFMAKSPIAKSCSRKCYANDYYHRVLKK